MRTFTILGAVCVIASCIASCGEKNPPQAKPIDPILLWPPDKIGASTENTFTFAKARIALIAESLPVSTTHPLTGDSSAKRYLEGFLASGRLDRSLLRIAAGKRAAREGKPIFLTMLPDYHANLGSQEEGSRVRQKRIRNYVEHSNFRIAFAEGTRSGPITWERRYEEYQETAIAMKAPIPPSLEAFKEFSKGYSLDFWWAPFIGSPSLELRGIDETELNKVILLIDELSRMPDSQRGLPQELFENTYTGLNVNVREQIILANIVLALREMKQEEALLVLGQLHVPTLTALAKEWGVNFTVVPFH